jgi:hypothetical protein
MLAQRLRELEDARVIVRREDRSRSGAPPSVEYELTTAGQELGPIIEHLGTWGQRWALADLGPDDLDPAYVMWAMHRTVNVAAFGAANAVIAFQLLDAPQAKRHWWLVVDGGGDGQVNLCLTNPGMAVDLTVVTKARPLALLTLGLLAPAQALRSGDVTLTGAGKLARSFGAWWPQPAAMPVEPEAAGAKRLARA